MPISLEKPLLQARSKPSRPKRLAVESDMTARTNNLDSDIDMLCSIFERLLSPLGYCLQTQADRDLSGRFVRSMAKHSRCFQSQLGQDVLVDTLMDGTPGFFVEFGALDGLNLSNTQFLEASRKWTGILAEPARGCHDALRSNRPNARIDTRCVWSTSGEKMEFVETEEVHLSTLAQFVSADAHASIREMAAGKYDVETVSLNQLLRESECPKQFDFLSVDTEGSEFDILAAADFDEFHPRIIAVEHNYQPSRQDIYSLLTKQGYQRVLTDLSWWDDWYVDEKTLETALARFKKRGWP